MGLSEITGEDDGSYVGLEEVTGSETGIRFIGSDRDRKGLIHVSQDDLLWESI